MPAQNMTLKEHLRISRFQIVAGTKEAQLDGDTISCQLTTAPLVIRKPVALCEEFANSPDTPSRILRFTKKYAPLSFGNVLKPGDQFVFELDGWQGYQNLFRRAWKRRMSNAGSLGPEIRVLREWEFPERSRLIFSRNESTLELQSLTDVINLSFAWLPWNRIRFCPAEGCEAPFFVAAHLRQTYCRAESCMDWGDRKLKREYWSRNKERLLKARNLSTGRSD
jgi:hypothetical protein